jgi:hypothetical protein
MRVATSLEISEAHGHAATNGIMYHDTPYKSCRMKPKDVVDGLSKTFLLGELSWDSHSHRDWMVGRAGHYIYSGKSIHWALNTKARSDFPPTVNLTPSNDVSFGSRHVPGGVHFSNGDGSVVFVSENTESFSCERLRVETAGKSLVMSNN